MGKRFNTTGICYPDEHYMVNMRERLKEIEAMVAAGEYFTINRARQYGKTTLLNLLEEELSAEYTVFFISFEGMGNDAYASEAVFCQSICRLLSRMLFYRNTEEIPPAMAEQLNQMVTAGTDMIGLSDFFSEICGQAARRVVFIIDEVDQASDKEVFLAFLGMLRDKYLKRKKQPTFQTVILASVYDIKNLKLKVRPESEHHYNSPWNIACDFRIDMNFSIKDIEEMLGEYEQDHHTGMNVSEIAKLIFDYTSGYPFLVSRLCKIVDERISALEMFSENTAWTHMGIVEAVKDLLAESNTLFDDMIKKTEDFPELKKMLYAVLFRGEIIPFNSDYYVLNIGILFGFLKNKDGIVVVSNRIFETRFYNLFLAEEVLDSKIYKEEAMDKDYEKCSDEELIVRLRDGESAITDYIMDKYKNLVRSKAKSMYILGADREDLIQEGMIGLFKAIRDYDTGRDASFFTFADLCVSRQMYTAVQAAGRQKHAPLNTYISLYAGGAENDGSGKGEEWELVDSLTSGFEKNPEELLIDKENVELLEKVMERELSGFEKQVLDLYLTGMTYSQIARVLGRDDKSTDNALQRIKGKLKKAILK